MDTQDVDIRIDLDDARVKLESGDAVALDLVQPGAWDRIDGVVKGAVRIPRRSSWIVSRSSLGSLTSSLTAPDRMRQRAPVWRCS